MCWKRQTFHQAIHRRLKIEAPNIGSLDEVKTRGGMSSICRWSSNSVCTHVWSSWLSFLFFFKYLHQDENACSWRWHVTEGRVWLPNPNGLWLPPPHFWKIILQFFYNGYGCKYARRYEGEIVWNECTWFPEIGTILIFSIQLLKKTYP